MSRPLRTGELEQELRRKLRRGLGEIRVDPFLPAIRALSAQAEALRGLEDPERLEVRGLEQDGGRALADLGLLPAHDPRERDPALGVGDQQVVWVEPALDAVQRSQGLAQ